jgi:hypothetical protein
MTPSPRPRLVVADPGPSLALEPLLTLDDLLRVLVCDQRTIRRLRAAGKFPPPDLRVGRLPRWKPETVRRWIERGGRP